MARFILVRHGVTEATGQRLGGRTPAPLTDEGRAQAEAVARRLAGTDVVEVYASPVARAAATAKPIAARHHLRVRRLAGVQEVEYGEWTDLPLKTLRRRKLWRLVQNAPSRVVFPGGEGIAAMQARAVAAVDGLADGHGARDAVVVVSHADVIKAVVAHYAGVPLDLFQRLVVAPASVTVVDVPPDRPPAVVCLNDTSHLPDRDRGGS